MAFVLSAILFLAILIGLTVWSYNAGQNWQVLLTPIALTLAATIAYRQLQHARHTRCADLLMQLHKTWDSDEYIQSRKMINQYSSAPTLEESSQKLKEAMKSFEDEDAQEYYMMLRIANFFENLGFLGERQYLKRKDALDLFGDTVENYWNLFSALVKYDKYERSDSQPNAWVYFEKLALGFPKEEGLEKNPSP